MPSKKSAKTVKKPVVKAEEALPVEAAVMSEPKVTLTDLVTFLSAEEAYEGWMRYAGADKEWEELNEAEKSGFERAAAFVAAGNAPRTSYERYVAGEYLY